MTSKSNLTLALNSTLIKRMLIGGGINLILIIILVSSVRYPDSEWGPYWMVRPVIVVMLAGVTGGAFYHLMDSIREQKQWNKILVNLFCFIVYVFGLWIGTVLGLNGTMWN